MLDNYRNEEADQFIGFYEKTETRFLAFEKAMGKESHHKEDFMASLVDDQCLEYMIQQYERENISEDDIWRFIHSLRWKNKNLFKQFYEDVNKKFDNKFIMPPERNFEKERKERSQRDFELLFNKQGVIDEINRIFKIEKQAAFSKKELFKLRTKHWPDLYYSDLAVEILRIIGKDDKITLENAIESISRWDWDWFCISKIYEKIVNDKDIRVSPEQKGWVQEWCYSKIDEVDFKNAITKTADRSYSIRWNAIYLFYFLRKFNLGYPKYILLDMLSFDYDGQGIEYLEDFLDEAEMSSRILINLEEGIIIDDVLKNHIDYCKRYGIKEGLKFALKEIVNTNREKYDEIRRVSLETVCDLSDSLTELEECLPDITDDFKWSVLDELFKSKSSYAYDFLSKLFKTSKEPDRFKAAEYLIKLQDLDAMAYYVDYIKTQRNFSKDMYNTSPLPSLHTIDAVPFLIELLEINYQKDFEQSDHFERLDRLVLDALTNIAFISDKNYFQIRRSIGNFIDKFNTIYNDVNWLYSFIEQLEQKYYINKSEQISIDEVIEKLKTVQFN